MKNIVAYILESYIIPVDIKAVQDFLISHYKVKTWEECIDKQKYGDCKKICDLITKKFPNMFDNLYDCNIDFSPIAIKKINDNDDMFGNHYVLSNNRKLYDFAKGANSINGVYVLTQFEDMHDKYDVRLTSKEQKLIKSKISRYIKK